MKIDKIMNKVFIDVNIFIDFLDEYREYSPKTMEKNSNFYNLHENAKKLFISLIGKNSRICISEDSITNIIYNLKNKKEATDKFMDILLNIDKYENLEIITFGKSAIKKAAKYYFKQINKHRNVDIEDVMQYFCALENRCNAIITNDKSFPKLHLPLIRTNTSIEDFQPKQTQSSNL